MVDRMKRVRCLFHDHDAEALLSIQIDKSTSPQRNEEARAYSLAHHMRIRLWVKTVDLHIVGPIDDWLLLVVETSSVSCKPRRLVEEMGSER